MPERGVPDPATARAAREAARVRAEYARRRRELPADFYSPARPANLFLRHGQERALLAALRRGGLLPLAGRRILEVGCGEGRWLRLFVELGARPPDLAGIDLEEERLDRARAQLQQADLRAGDAARLPWADASFDVVFQSTVMSSILDPPVQEMVAAEMLRVLRPEGAVLWYDFRVDNPRNENVKGIRRRRLRRLFPGCRAQLRRVTLAPPIARRLVPFSWTLACLLESLRLLNSHDFALLRRR